MILGLTGNIAAGKSTVAQALARRGALVVDADQLARDVVAAGSPVLAQLVARFGRQILQADGSLNRELLGRLVFADEEARSALNRIMHPAIAELARKTLAVLRKRSDIPLVVYEAPLLFEAGAEKRVDKVLLVRIDPEVQLQRLMERNGFDEHEARRRIAAQLGQDEKAARADFIIDNSGTPAELDRQLDRLWPELTAGR
ncbi:dephospho-CoA kinase [Pelobacter seleniigenes]|uniref:dephospho-CoA kinase n=1 Tax=Pelobacter seleniigenes TaxID=407188 RepID=UPI0004A7481C|nr:dephospho-CoA kinase [Pelobacter seleniigenes]